MTGAELIGLIGVITVVVVAIMALARDDGYHDDDDDPRNGFYHDY